MIATFFMVLQVMFSDFTFNIANIPHIVFK